MCVCGITIYAFYLHHPNVAAILFTLHLGIVCEKFFIKNLRYKQWLANKNIYFSNISSYYQYFIQSDTLKRDFFPYPFTRQWGQRLSCIRQRMTDYFFRAISPRASLPQTSFHIAHLLVGPAPVLYPPENFCLLFFGWFHLRLRYPKRHFTFPAFWWLKPIAPPP
jgi:hypothetical protein